MESKQRCPRCGNLNFDIYGEGTRAACNVTACGYKGEAHEFFPAPQWVPISQIKEFTGLVLLAVWDDSAQEYFRDIGWCDDRGWHRRMNRRGKPMFYQSLGELPAPPEEGK